MNDRLPDAERLLAVEMQVDQNARDHIDFRAMVEKLSKTADKLTELVADLRSDLSAEKATRLSLTSVGEKVLMAIGGAIVAVFMALFGSDISAAVHGLLHLKGSQQ